MPSRSLATSARCAGKRSDSQVRDGGGDDAHDDGATAALDEDVDAKAGDAGQAVGNVARSVFAQSGDRLFVVADQIGGDVAGVIGGKSCQSRHLYRNELAVDLNLGRASGRKNQIADFFRGAEHGGKQSGRSYFAAAGMTFQGNSDCRDAGRCHSILD